MSNQDLTDIVEIPQQNITDVIGTAIVCDPNIVCAPSGCPTGPIGVTGNCGVPPNAPPTKKKKAIKKIDYLDEDDPITKPYRQSWVCISFVSPEGIMNCKIRGLKVRGVFEKQEQANARAKELQLIDPDFHVFVGEVGKWLGWDPDPNSAEDQEYREDELNKLMKGYKENLEKTKQMEQERKKELLDESRREAKNKAETRRERLKRKAEENKLKKLSDVANTADSDSEDEQPKVSHNITEKELKLKEVEKELDEKINLAKTKETEVEQTQGKINTMSKQLDKMKSLYESIQKKKSNTSV